MLDRSKFTGTSMFIVWQQLIEFELDNLEIHIAEIANDLKEKQRDLERKYSEAKASLAPHEDEGELASYFDDEAFKYYDILPVYTFNPLFLILYGRFEYWLKRLCDQWADATGEPRASSTSKTWYIDESRKYLKGVAGIELDEVNKEWEKIKNIKKIRNCIIHNDANVRRGKEEITEQPLYRLLIKDKRIKLDQHGNFYIRDKEFLIESVVLIRKYIVIVSNKLLTKMSERKKMTMPTASPTREEHLA